MTITRKKEKLIRKWILRSLLIIFILIISGTAYFFFSPVPTAWIVNKAFEGGMSVAPDNYIELLQQTSMIENVDYHSRYPDGELDIIYPKQTTNQTPVIFWIHGGAYVGGDKSDITQYAVQLAANGYAVVNINYALAPKGQYPAPLVQVSEAYTYIKNNADKYGLSLDRIYIAGDSAGAQLAGQFVNIQSDSDYASQVGIAPVVDRETIKGTLLFCGPYELSKLASIEGNDTLKFLMRRIGWAYIGTKDWENQPQTQLASIIDHVSGRYPPTFITDGNVGSFEEHGKDLAVALTNHGVPVKSIFYDKSAGELGHEYQFLMNTPAAQQTFKAVIQFLNAYR